MPDATAMPLGFLVKSLLVKARRRLLGRQLDQAERVAWTTSLVSDLEPAASNVRNYVDRRSLRGILQEVTSARPLGRACEVGCGYGRLTMVLREFATEVVGFEREQHLVETAAFLQPGIEFHVVDTLADARSREPFDLVLIWAVLQHMTDAEAGEVLTAARALAPAGYILCVEKTGKGASPREGSGFISRSRPVSDYEALMAPYRLELTRDRGRVPGSSVSGTCMLFASPAARRGGHPSRSGA